MMSLTLDLAARAARASLLALALALPLPLHAQAPSGADTLPLSIDEAVSLALGDGDEARLAAALVEVADAQLTVARAAGLPQLRANANYNRALENARAQVVGQVFNQPETYSTSLSLTQPVFQGGRLRAASRAAGSVRSAARLTAQETRASVALGVQRAYLEALFAARVAEIQAQGLTLASERLRQVEQFQAAGRAARYDVLRARVERANLEPGVIRAQNDRELALLQLKRLTNIPVARPVTLTSSIDSAAAATLLRASPGDSTTDRPSIRAAELQLRARQEGVRIARADYFPTVNFSFQTGYQAFPPRGFGFPTSLGRLDNQFCAAGAAPTQRCQNGGWFSDRSLALAVSWPVFDGFRTRGNVSLARAQVRVAEVQLQQERELVDMEAAGARAELERARAVYVAQQQNAAEAEEAFRLASLRFARGLSTQLEVSDAQLALSTAQTGAARAVYDLYLAVAELSRALGRTAAGLPSSALPLRPVPPSGQ